jgi:hypothetical protein
MESFHGGQLTLAGKHHFHCFSLRGIVSHKQLVFSHYLAIKIFSPSIL